MRQPSRLPHVLLLRTALASALAVAAACAVDSSGLPGGPNDAGPRGSGGRPVGASGGNTGTGGDVAGSGGAVGSGGMTGTGGDDGSGGSGSGGSLGSGGSVGSGGVAGTIGSTGGAGGTMGGAGGRVGTGGMPGSGGTGTGGRAGTGGRTGTGGRDGGTGGSAACGPTTCPDGCCQAGVCVQGRSADACGRGGAVCRACKACFRCAQGVCGLNAQSTWAVSCKSAVIDEEDRDGDDWDSRSGGSGSGSGLNGGGPDAYCEVTNSFQPRLSSTRTVLDDFEPTWDQVIATASANELLVSPVDIAVMDEDLLTSQRICSAPLDLTEADFERGSVTFSSESCSSLIIGLTCASTTP